MHEVPNSKPNVSPLVIAGLVLAASEHLRRLSFSCPLVSKVLEATGASHASAYEYRDKILALLPSLWRPPGRPTSEPPEAIAHAAYAVGHAVLRFVLAHPGAAAGASDRHRYSDPFRHFVIELRREHEDLDLRAFADAAQVPLGTIEDWLRNPRPEPSTAAAKEGDETAIPRIEAIIEAFKSWDGSFAAFCEHVQGNLRIPYGRTAISDILEQYGVRRRRRRPGHAPDEKALRRSFETFFAGAQWVGDGKQLEIQLNDESFKMNLELEVDAHTAAFVGASVRDEEDGAAVVQAFQDGVATTGAPPIAQLLDNRPSNHTPEVAEALGDVLNIHATPGRGQNKAHVEGAFGLFEQTAPKLEIYARTPRELALAIAALVTTTWFRAMNHRPRRDRAGRSRVELYRSAAPTEEQVTAAKRALLERLRRQQLAEQTRRARQDPIARTALDGAFERLGLPDPDGNVRAAIAGFPLNAVLSGIAIFEGKHSAGTLPPDVDGRYLLGIVRNISRDDEARHTAEALLTERLAARDHALAHLEAERRALVPAHASDLERINAMLDRALAADRTIDILFWIHAAADAFPKEEAQRVELARRAAGRIHRTHAAPHAQRLLATRILLETVIAID